MTLTSSRDLVDVLVPEVERLFERHLASTKPWMAHELIPWERAVQSATRNTGTLLDDEDGYKVMARVAADENLHYLFYRDLVSAALEVDPSGTVCAIERQVRTFEMPGAGIPDFTAHANAIAAAGIYDLLLHHDQVLVPVVLRHWGIETIEGLSPDAECARERIVSHIARIGRIGQRLASRRQSVSVATPA